MALGPGEEIGEETHPSTDQFVRVEEGKGVVSIDGQNTRVKSAMAILIPAGTRHNIRNTGKKPLQLYTLYAPPEHPEGAVQHRPAYGRVLAGGPTTTRPRDITNRTR